MGGVMGMQRRRGGNAGRDSSAHRGGGAETNTSRGKMVGGGGGNRGGGRMLEGEVGVVGHGRAGAARGGSCDSLSASSPTRVRWLQLGVQVYICATLILYHLFRISVAASRVSLGLPGLYIIIVLCGAALIASVAYLLDGVVVGVMAVRRGDVWGLFEPAHEERRRRYIAATTVLTTISLAAWEHVCVTLITDASYVGGGEGLVRLARQNIAYARFCLPGAFAPLSNNAWSFATVAVMSAYQSLLVVVKYDPSQFWSTTGTLLTLNAPLAYVFVQLAWRTNAWADDDENPTVAAILASTAVLGVIQVVLVAVSMYIVTSTLLTSMSETMAQSKRAALADATLALSAAVAHDVNQSLHAALDSVGQLAERMQRQSGREGSLWLEEDEEEEDDGEEGGGDVGGGMGVASLSMLGEEDVRVDEAATERATRRLLSVLRSNLLLASRTVSDILDQASLAQGKMVLREAETNALALVRGVAKIIRGIRVSKVEVEEGASPLSLQYRTTLTSNGLRHQHDGSTRTVTSIPGSELVPGESARSITFQTKHRDAGPPEGPGFTGATNDDPSRPQSPPTPPASTPAVVGGSGGGASERPLGIGDVGEMMGASSPLASPLASPSLPSSSQSRSAKLAEWAVVLDGLRVQQVLLNGVSNAAKKAGFAGRVVIRLDAYASQTALCAALAAEHVHSVAWSCMPALPSLSSVDTAAPPAAAHRPVLRVRVIDTGPGLQGVDRASLFQAYVQGTAPDADDERQASLRRRGATGATGATGGTGGTAAAGASSSGDRSRDVVRGGGDVEDFEDVDGLGGVAADADRRRGRGLGLAMTARIVGTMGGAVDLRDRTDGTSGAIFDVFLPFAFVPSRDAVHAPVSLSRSLSDSSPAASAAVHGRGRGYARTSAAGGRLRPSRSAGRGIIAGDEDVIPVNGGSLLVASSVATGAGLIQRLIPSMTSAARAAAAPTQQPSPPSGAHRSARIRPSGLAADRDHDVVLDLARAASPESALPGAATVATGGAAATSATSPLTRQHGPPAGAPPLVRRPRSVRVLRTANPALATLRVVVIDDEPTNVQMMVSTFQHLVSEIESFQRGEDALAKLLTSRQTSHGGTVTPDDTDVHSPSLLSPPLATTHFGSHAPTAPTSSAPRSPRLSLPAPDVVLCDFQLGRGISGATVTQRLRQAGYSGIVVICSGGLTPDDIDLCTRAGMNAYLPRPFERRQLIHIVEELLRVAAAASGHGSSQSRTSTTHTTTHQSMADPSALPGPANPSTLAFARAGAADDSGGPTTIVNDPSASFIMPTATASATLELPSPSTPRQ